jgi:hypothetical protein
VTPQERLQQAEDAYHRLMLGQSVVEVRDSNGESVRYTATNRNALSAYINELKRQLGVLDNRPARGVF